MMDKNFLMQQQLRRCLDFKNVKVISFGIRNLSKEEMIFYNKNKKKLKFFGVVKKINGKYLKFVKYLKIKMFI